MAIFSSIDRRGRVRFRDAKGVFRRSPNGAMRIFDEIGPRLAIGPAVTASAVESVLELYKDEVENWMKENASWEDRSGAAREGLSASVEKTGLMEYQLAVFHTVSYGIYLEVRWNGRYAILMPAVEHWGPFLMQDMEVFG